MPAPRAGQGSGTRAAAGLTRPEVVPRGLGGLRRQSRASSSGPVSRLRWDEWQLLQMFLSCTLKVGLSMFSTINFVIIVSCH